MNLNWCTRRTGSATLSTTIGGVAVIAALLATAACTPGPASTVSAESPSPLPSPSATQILPPGADLDGADGPLTAPVLPVSEATLGDTISFETGIDVRIDSVKATEVSAETPGEVSGSAVAVTVTATNGSTQPQVLDSAVVVLVADDGEYGIGTTAGDPAPFSGAVAPGDSTSATYLFMLSSAANRMVTVSVNYAAGEPVAVFSGKVS